MNAVAEKKCIRHPAREAVARCPGCGEHFCRECVVEHAGVLLCSSCLAKAAAPVVAPRGTNWSKVSEILLTVAGVVLLWVVFYGFGQLLKAIPATVHEGTVWQAGRGT
jgi:hypothetical protein